MIAALKFVHIAALVSWCAALIALPLLMVSYTQARGPRDYARFRLLTHMGYIGFATPAALIAIAAGGGLIFAAEVFAPWFLLKLAFVAGMVLVHSWLGHLIQRSGETRSTPWRGWPLIGLALVLPMMLTALALVLLKPDLGPLRDLLPDQFLSPRGRSL